MITLIPFVHELTYNLKVVEKVNEMRPSLHRAVQGLLKMGHKLESLPPTKLDDLKTMVMQATGGTVDERLAVGYSRLLWLTKKVSIVVLENRYKRSLTMNFCI